MSIANNYILTKYLNNMVTTNTIGYAVTMVNLICLKC